METQDTARELTAAFLDAQEGRIIEELTRGLEQAGSSPLLPVHRALFRLAAGHIREPVVSRVPEEVFRALAGVFSQRQVHLVVSGQIALRSFLHRALREDDGPHKAAELFLSTLALTGDTIDGIIGALTDLAWSGDRVSAGSAGWEKLVEIGKERREFETLSRITRDLLNTRDPPHMFETLQEGLLGAFCLRSILIATVNREGEYVEVVSNYPGTPATGSPIGWRYDLSHPDILCDVARTGRTEVIDGWDPRYHERVVRPAGGVTFRERPRGWNEGRTAFFVPILAGERGLWWPRHWNTTRGESDMGIRILVADDHRIMRSGLRSLVEKEPGMEVVAEAEDGRMAVRLVEDLSPDVVVMDIGMPGLNGIEATRQVIEKAPGARVVALSMHSDSQFVAGMLTAGASGYLLKDCTFSELVRAIRVVAAGQVYLSPCVAGVVVEDYVRHASATGGGPDFLVLTAREREVLQLLAEGETAKEIAYRFRVSVKTVENHHQKIGEKLDLHSIADLTRYAIRTGLASLEA